MNERARPGKALTLYAIISYLYLSLPIFFLVLFSFNTSKFSVHMEGLTLRWYDDLFKDRLIWEATRNTLIVAFTSTLVSTVIGTAAAIALHRYEFRGKGFSEATLYIPVIIPEVVMGISLLVFFVMINLNLGLVSITLSHIAFNIPFVALVVRARLHGYDNSIDEAAMDLGANEMTTFRRVTLPTILPGILSGAMLALTLSLDDYVITYFTAGPGSTTLPLRVFSMVRFMVTPEVNALSTLWVLIVFLILVIGQIAQSRRA